MQTVAEVVKESIAATGENIQVRAGGIRAVGSQPGLRSLAQHRTDGDGRGPMGEGPSLPPPASVPAPSIVHASRFHPCLLTGCACSLLLQVRRFVKFNLGEGLEKRSNDFAAEVAQQTQAKADEKPAPKPVEAPAPAKVCTAAALDSSVGE